MLHSHAMLTRLLGMMLLCSLPITNAAHKFDKDDKKKGRAQVEQQAPASPKARSARPDRQVPVTRDRRTPKPEVRKPTPRISHDRIYSTRRDPRNYRSYSTYRYHTYFIAPILRPYPSIGFRITVLPRAYVRIVVGTLPYYYFDGIFYQSFSGGYVVVHAPIGARVRVLPASFIFFHVGLFTYYYVHDTYYTWDEGTEVYVVAKKPAGADKAIASETKGRLFVYPQKGQSEKQQAKDRYACHRWAVKESGVDPIENEDESSPKNKSDYKRAISACLEGRGYVVK